MCVALDNKLGCLEIRQQRHEKGQRGPKSGQVFREAVEIAHEGHGHLPKAEKAGGPGEAHSPWLLC